ncbi:hypothetical protein AVEN_19795-1 [Araneus ventricosus]|uniref:Transposase Tc1-like domain-containing protein n=1 Tax=Araneus ventricosus TaxID=182803 RepID=A0A4Y2HBX6_ARAVE|nr:hypothetical protein AVEN_19795-1 [Araneus ventricosus]
MASQLSVAAGTPISHQTVQRRLHEGGLFAQRPFVCVPLSPSHVRARLHWTREHRSWTPEQWGHVLFTDESRFNIQNDSRRAMNQGPAIGRQTSSKETIAEVAGYLSGQEYQRTAEPTSMCSLGVPSQLYDMAMKSYTLLCGLLSLQWVLTRCLWTITPARPHRARLVRSYLGSETIPQMAWSARSPDQNPIEHVWDMLVRRIAGSSVSSGTLHELQQALLQEWALLPQQAINDTIASTLHRCQAYISARGYHTRY